MYIKFKRLIDIIVSIAGLIILSPVFLLIIISIKLDSRGPVLFKQKRLGINKSQFNILKFRTMKIDAPKEMATRLLDDPDQWITSVGKFLRKTSLDELPQIINIIKGEMSIVGPRPILWNEHDLTEERDKYGIYNILPGLTGWAQINGRDELTVEEKARLDGYYVENMGFMLDVKCFLLTIVTVFKRNGFVEGKGGFTLKRQEREKNNIKKGINNELL